METDELIGNAYFHIMKAFKLKWVKKNTALPSGVYLKLIMVTLEQCVATENVTKVNFEQISDNVLVFSLLVLAKLMLAALFCEKRIKFITSCKYLI